MGTYMFSWNNGETTQNISELPQGEYEVTITDTNGCQITETYELLDPPPLDVQIEIQPIICNGDSNGQLTADASGGVPIPEDGYEFEWTKTGDAGFSANTQTISNLNAGEYRVVVTDNNGITTEASYTLEEPMELSFTYNQTNNTCFDAAEGSIEILPQGGVPPYAYAVDGITFQPNPLFSNLPAGDYTVTLTDANGCTVNEPTTLTQPEELVVESDVVQITAFGETDGAITVTGIGGTPPYEYLWSTGETTQNISPLSQGSYDVTITDDNGCQIMETYNIIEPSELQINITEESSLLCFGDTIGALFADVSGGVTPYQYQWFTIDGGQNPISQEEALAENLLAAAYQVMITDNNGIQVLSEIYNLQQPEELIIQEENVTHVICNGASTGAIDVSILGGVSPYFISWNNGEATADLMDIPAGTYTLTVEDMNGCTAVTVVAVNNSFEPLLVANATVTDASNYGGTDGEIAITFSGGASPYNILLNGNTIVEDTEELMITMEELTAGDYELIITDNEGCSITENYTITQPDVVQEVIIRPSCFGDCDGSIALTVNEGVGDFDYLWSTGSEEQTISNLCAGSYEVTITGLPDGPLVRTFVVENPELLTINLGEDLTLCQDQTVTLSAAIEDEGASYSWSSTNGLLSDQPEIEVSEAGTYSIWVTNSNGCQAYDEITVTTSIIEVDVQFLVSTYVYANQPFVAIDVSYPIPTYVEWILPDGATMINENTDLVELVFDNVGEYEVTMMADFGNCRGFVTKKVMVIAGEGAITDENTNTQSSGLEEFMLYPNPSDGSFSAKITLKDSGTVSLRIFSLANNSLLEHKTANGELTYDIPFDLSQVPSGLYAVVLETPFGNQVRKIIIE